MHWKGEGNFDISVKAKKCTEGQSQRVGSSEQQNGR